MSCENVQERISLLLDRKLAAGEGENVLAHIESCRECGAHLESLAEQRAMLRSMAQPAIPPVLTAKLRVIASHERERRLARVSFSTRLGRWRSRFQLAFDNLMRPLALPFAGGLISTLLLLGTMLPSLSFNHDIRGQEFFTPPSGTLVSSPWNQGADADAKDFPRIESPDAAVADYVNVVDLTIDEFGRVADWSIVRGDLTDDMKSIILLGRFEPATAFGVRTSGTIRVVQSQTPCIHLRCSATVRG